MKVLQTQEQIYLDKKKREEEYNKAHIGCSRCSSCKCSNYYKWTVPEISIKGFLLGIDYIKDLYECKQCSSTWESGKYRK